MKPLTQIRESQAAASELEGHELGEESLRESEEKLSVGEIHRRASSGVLLITARGILARALGFASNIVLAHFLLPGEFGLVAIGFVIQQVGQMFSNGGLGTALIRQAEPPLRIDLQAVQGFQLVLTCTVVGLTAVAAWVIGGNAWVTALIVASLPFMSIRTPAAIQLERRLEYRVIARVQVVEVVSYYGWAITTVAAGWGVWGLASAAVVQGAAGSLLMMAGSPMHILRPRLRWERLRRLLGFGVRYQANSLIDQVRQQGLNVGTGALVGLTGLGLWSMASRIVLMPSLFFQALWKVAYPANARLLAAGVDPRPTLRRGSALVAISSGVMFVAIIGSAPAFVPAALGERWTGLLWVLPPAALGQVLVAPLAVGVVGYLWAKGEASTVLRSNISRTVTWCLVTFALIHWLGIVALGVGWLAGSLAQVKVLTDALKRHLGTRMLELVLPPAAYAALAGGLGWALAEAAGPSLASAALGAAVGEVVFVTCIALTQLALLRDAWGFGRRSLRAALAGSP